MLLGVAVGVFGTLVGAGGGFLLVPVLLLLFPGQPAAALTATSLAVVFANSVSGSISYYRLHRGDYRSGWVMGAATVPGAVLGAVAVAYVSRRLFDPVMGAVLLGLAVFLVARPEGRRALVAAGPLSVQRRLRDSDGNRYEYRFNLGLAAAASLGVGFISSFFGIGGGILHVPLLISFFAFPAHVATATSQFVLLIMSAVGTLTHLLRGDLSAPGVGLRTLLLAAGVIAGAPLGAQLSRRVIDKVIVRLLAGALAVVGVRLLLAPVFGGA